MIHEDITEPAEESERPKPQQKGYLLIQFCGMNGPVGIQCLRCGMTSWEENDVKEKYCGNCQEFHEQEVSL